MAVAFVKHIGTYFPAKSSGTTISWLWPSSTAAVGNLVVAYFVFDNAATASKPTIANAASITKPAGETNNWVFLGAARSTSTSSGAFSSGELWAIRTSVAWTTPTITATLDTAVVMRSFGFSEFSGVASTARSTAGTNYSTTTTAASATTTGTAPVIGDLALGLIFQSNSATVPTGDNDTSAGSWSAVQGIGSTGSSTATNNMGAFQYKVLTAATHQTLNNQAVLTAGNGSIVAVLQAAPAVTPVASFTSSATTVSAGSTVTFTDTSTNIPTTWAWDFGTGASPATASTQGPHVVTYSTVGTSSVTLTAGNTAGSDAVDAPTSITVEVAGPINYVQTAWGTAGTSGTGGYYKDVTLTGLAAGDLLVAWGANQNYGNAASTRSITTTAGATSAWTTSLPAVVNAADCDFIAGWATVTSGTTATVRVQVRHTTSTQHMGAGVWVISAAVWGGTPTFTVVGPGDADGQVSLTRAATSTVLFALADWNAIGLNSGGTIPAGAIVDTDALSPGIYSTAARRWTAQAPGTSSYGLWNTSGLDSAGAFLVVPAAPTAETLVDDFSGDLSKWPDSYGGVVIEAGRAKIPVTATYPALWTASIKYDMAGSFMFAQVTPPAPGGNRQLTMEMRLDTANKSILLYEGDYLYFRTYTASAETTHASVAYSATAHAWWKTHSTGPGNIRFSTSPDGTTWTEQTSATVSWSLAATELLFVGGVWGAGVDGVGYVDNVNTVPVAAPVARTRNTRLSNQAVQRSFSR